jgi:hypothetical protein
MFLPLQSIRYIIVVVGRHVQPTHVIAVILTVDTA